MKDNRMSVCVTLSKSKMDTISKRAKELKVPVGALASFLLDQGLGVLDLSRVRVLEDPHFYLEDKE